MPQKCTFFSKSQNICWNGAFRGSLEKKGPIYSPTRLRTFLHFIFPCVFWELFRISFELLIGVREGQRFGKTASWYSLLPVIVIGTRRCGLGIRDARGTFRGEVLSENFWGGEGWVARFWPQGVRLQDVRREAPEKRRRRRHFRKCLRFFEKLLLKSAIKTGSSPRVFRVWYHTFPNRANIGISQFASQFSENVKVDKKTLGSSVIAIL